jgi:predicted dehydrogenase
MQLMRTFRAALLGCGRVSTFQLRAWSKIEGVQIVALYNRSVEKARQRAVDFGIPLEHVYGDYSELLSNEQLDFVDIATAPQLHRQQVEAAAARRLHVLCQKPAAPSLEDMHAMMAACQQAGVLFSINENWRWRSWYREVKRLLDRGAIGTPRFLRFTSRRNLTWPVSGGPPPLLVKQPYTAEMEQLIVYEWGTHLIDVARYLLGEIQQVYARMAKTSPDFKGEDRALLVLELSGATGVIDISWATVGDEAAEQRSNTMLEHFVIEGDEGVIELLPEPHCIFRLSTRRESWERPVYTTGLQEAYQESYTAAQRHFYECLRDGLEPETVASDNFKTLQATQAAYRSAALGQAVRLEP